MFLSIEFKNTEMGCIATLGVSGVTEPIWLGRRGIGRCNRERRWTGIIGWAPTEEEARLDVLKDVKKVIKRLEKKDYLRPSQVCTLEIMKVALVTI